MLANFIEEFCTGTGDTLTLTGALASRIAASEAFADGQAIYYVVEDANGVNKVAGKGTFNAAGNTITRSDNWSWNGTTYDTSPVSNIALSAGTHTVRVSLTSEILKDSTTQTFIQQTEPTDWKVGDVWIEVI